MKNQVIILILSKLKVLAAEASSKKRQIVVSTVMNDNDLKDVFIADGKDTVKCKYCGKLYKARKADLLDHLKKKKHTDNVEKYEKMQNFMKNCNTLYLKTARAELIWSLFLVQNNLSFNVSQSASMVDLFKKMFMDSQIASQIVTNRHKVEKIITMVLAPALRSQRKQHLQKLYSLSIDFSRDVSNKNNFLIVATYFQNEKCCIMREVYKVVEHNFTSGFETYQKLRKILEDDRIDLKNMIAISIDNAADMSSSEKGVSGYLTKIDNGIFIKRCENHNLALPLNHILKKPKKSIDINEYLRFIGEETEKLKIEEVKSDYSEDNYEDYERNDDDSDQSVDDSDKENETYIQYFYDIPHFLRKIAAYFHYSYKREAEYELFLENFLKEKKEQKSDFYRDGEDYVKELPKINGFSQTRWCYISDALKDLIKNWEPLLNFWDNKLTNAKQLKLKKSEVLEIGDILDFMRKEPFKFFTRLLLWISDLINKESLNYQNEKSKIQFTKIPYTY